MEIDKSVRITLVSLATVVCCAVAAVSPAAGAVASPAVASPPSDGAPTLRLYTAFNQVQYVFSQLNSRQPVDMGELALRVDPELLPSLMDLYAGLESLRVSQPWSLELPTFFTSPSPVTHPHTPLQLLPWLR